jgi:ABC-type transport system substrate-binding protein
VNLVGPNGGGPLGSPDVRQALEYAINKAATVQVQGGPRVARPARQSISSTVTGYRPDADQFATPMDKGDPAKARELLNRAGYADRLSLKLAYMQSNTYALIAQTVQESFRRAGIDVQLTSYTAADFYGRLLENSQNARRGVWDLALAGWYPDWIGGNNGRSVIQPLFDGRSFGHVSMDYGGYNSLAVNAAIDRALAAPRVEDSEKAWAEAASQIMKDMAIIPLYENKQVRYHSGRVRNCLLSMWSLNCDMTGVWLKDESAAEDKP